MRINHLNLREIAESGQCFRWKEIFSDAERTCYSVVFAGTEYKITQCGNEFSFDIPDDEVYGKLGEYLDFDTDYDHIEELIFKSGDKHLIEAFKKGSGIRILKQDLWETIISFLISQNNNIPRIKGSIEAICKKAGIPAKGSDSQYAFPGPFDVPEDFFDDASLGLGYRNVYLKEMYAFARENCDWLEYIKSLGYEDARAELLKRKGIGPKVADCIALFALHHIDAFPIDTHVKQLLSKYYSNGFDFEYFKGYAGIIQQYLFYYEIK